MAIKPRRVVRRQVEEEVEPEEVVEVDDEGYDVDEDDTDPDVELDVDDEEVDDEPEPEPAHRVARRVVQVASPTRKVAPPPAPVKAAAKPAPKPVAPAAKPVAKPAPKPVKQVAEEEVEPKTIKVQKVETMALANLFEGLLTGLHDGQAIIISRRGETTWQLSTSDQIKGVSVKLSGEAYWDKVTTPEYKEWIEGWTGLDYPAKVKEAKKIGAEWEKHADQRVDLIRISQAVMEKLGIEKYLPDYRTRASRDALKG